MATYNADQLEQVQLKRLEQLQILDQCKKKTVSDVTFKQLRLSRSKSTSSLTNPHWNVTISNIVPSANIQLGKLVPSPKYQKTNAFFFRSSYRKRIIWSC